MKDKYDKILDRILKIGKVIQFLLFLCVLMFIMFTVRCGTEKVDRYKAYLCYDYHLAASDTSDKIGKYKDDPTVTGENTFYYYKIKGESLDHFVETEVVRGVLFPSHRRYVLHNPEKYVNI